MPVYFQLELNDISIRLSYVSFKTGTVHSSCYLSTNATAPLQNYTHNHMSLIYDHELMATIKHDDRKYQCFV